MDRAGHGPPTEATLTASRTVGSNRSEAGHNRGIVARFAVIVAVFSAPLLAVAGCASAPGAGQPGVIVIAATATANEPSPALSWADVSLLRSAGTSSTNAVAYIVNPASGQPVRVSLTPRRANGEVEYGPRRSALLAATISRIQALIGSEAATGPFDLLDTMFVASRVGTPPATMLLLSSGVTTAGGLDLRDVGWDASPSAVATQLDARGLLPDLKGWTVVFSGLGQVTGRQPSLPLPQLTTLSRYWLAICRATGAAACRIDDSPRSVHPSHSIVAVPVVPVPQVYSVDGPHQQETLLPADLLFAFASARLLPGVDQYLAPIAQRARVASMWLSITGQASPDGGDESYNKALSLARAQAVEARLIALGVPPSKITRVIGVGTAGQSCTVDGVLDEASCAQLRRVVIVLSPLAAAVRWRAA